MDALPDELIDVPIREDPTLDPAEKETTLHFSKDDERVWISTEMRACISDLLGNDSFELEHWRLSDGYLVSISGTIPVACLSIKAVPRSDGNVPSGVVSQSP